MARDLENVDDTIPGCSAAEYLFDRHQLLKRSRAAVLRFDGLTELFWLNPSHL